MKVRFITFGCSNNFAETEMMAGLLKENGFKVVNEGENLVIINVCSVKGPSFNKGLREIRKSKVPVIVTGCIPEGSIGTIKEISPNSSLVDTHSLKKIVDAAHSTLNGEPVEMLGKTGTIKSCLPRIRLNPVIGILPISSGCTSSCAYCSTRLIKGSLLSYPPESLVKELKSFIKDGCREIWVTAQDTGNYGLDIGTTLPDLLEKLLDIKGEFRIRLGMTNPNFVLKYLDRLKKILIHDKMFRFIHMPVQSGSDKILDLMGRKYTSGEYAHIVNELKRDVPNITISTDMIVGFPTEIKADFMESMELLRQTKPDILNISRFWPHPKTAAASLKQVSTNESKERSSTMKILFDKISMENNRAWLGWKGNIIIDEKGKSGTWIGRNFAYKPVIVKGDYKLGEKIEIEVKKTTVYDLRGN